MNAAEITKGVSHDFAISWQLTIITLDPMADGAEAQGLRIGAIT